jgi:hypothetical protein
MDITVVSIIVGVALLAILYLWLRFIAPPVVLFNLLDPQGFMPQRFRSFYVNDIDMKLQNTSATFTLRSAVTVEIPNGQWRHIPIGGYFTPCGTFRFPFTNIVIPLLYSLDARVFVTSEKARKRALRAHPKFMQDDGGQWGVLVYSDYPFPVTIARGEVFAHVEFYRTQRVIYFKRSKLKEAVA